MARCRAMLTTGALLALALTGARAEDYGDDYQTGDYGRLRYRDNGVTIVRAAPDTGEPASAEADVNAPIFPGDTISTDGNERAEVELAGGAMVRLDEVSDLTLLALPGPPPADQETTLLQLQQGTIRLTTPPTSTYEVRVDTPSASLYASGPVDARIEVDRDGTTRVLSWRGAVEVTAQGASVIAHAGGIVDVYPGAQPDTPASFNTLARDSFDRWVDERVAVYRVREHHEGTSPEVYGALPEEVQPYYVELSYYGGWVYQPQYGYVWCPRGQPVGWRPYYHGYWDWGPHGYFWVGNEPWGWAPYHYGRWVWGGSIGWAWVPGHVFAGAWVSWSWGPSYIGWCPLDYWNRPVYVGPHYYHGGYDPHCWTFVDHAHLGYHDTSRWAVTADHVGHDHLGRAAYLTRPPRVSPGSLARSGAARDRAWADAQQRARPMAQAADPAAGRGVRLDDLERRLAARTDLPRREKVPGVRAPLGNSGRPATRSPLGAASSRAGNVQRVERVENPARRVITANPDPRPTAVAPSRSAPATDRLRDVYRRVAEPRTTRDTAAKPEPRAAAPRSALRPGTPTEGRAAAPPAQSPPPQERNSSPVVREPARGVRTAPSLERSVRPNPPQTAVRSMPRSTPPQTAARSVQRPTPPPSAVRSVQRPTVRSTAAVRPPQRGPIQRPAAAPRSAPARPQQPAPRASAPAPAPSGGASRSGGAPGRTSGGAKGSATRGGKSGGGKGR